MILLQLVLVTTTTRWYITYIDVSKVINVINNILKISHKYLYRSYL